MTDRGKLLIRTFGVLHLIYGTAGYVFLVDAAIRIFHGGVHFGKFPYERQAYYVMTGANVLLVSTLILAGCWLVRLLRRGVVLSNFVLTIEVLYWLASTFASHALAMHGNRAAEIGYSIGAVAGIGDMGTNAQFLTGYPLIALVVLNIARRRLDRKGDWNRPEPLHS